MSKHNPAPTTTISIDEIRGIYPHFPSLSSVSTTMERPAFLVFVHDQEGKDEAAGQRFLAHNNNFDTRATQPLAVAAEMCRADYKIFDLTPPTPLITTEKDVALAISYGMVTVEQGVDFIALYAIGQECEPVMPHIKNMDDLAVHGALNLAACYGVAIAARMAGIPISLPAALSDCLSRIAASEGWTTSFITIAASQLRDFALNLIQTKANILIV